MNQLSKDSLVNFRAGMAYHTGAIAGIISLVEDIPELRGVICDDTKVFQESELRVLKDCLHRFHRTFYL